MWRTVDGALGAALVGGAAVRLMMTWQEGGRQRGSGPVGACASPPAQAHLCLVVVPRAACFHADRLLCCAAVLLPLGQVTVGQLLPWARDHLLTERPELFMKGESV